MTASSYLLDALRMTEIRDVEEFAAMTKHRARATDQGSILYQLHDPRGARAPNGEVLTRVGDTSIGSLQLSYVTDRYDMRVTFPEAHPLSLCIMTVLEGLVQYRPSGSGTASTAASGGTLLCQVMPGAQGLTAGGSERLNLWVNAHTLSRRLEAMLEQRLSVPLVFAPERDWPRGAAESLKRLVEYVAAELADPYSLFAGGIGAAAFEELVMRTLLEGVPHTYTERLARVPSAAPPHTVERAIAFMREHAAQPITVEDIAKAAGCSARALAAAFRTRQGRTVTSALHDLRLDAARAAFATGDPALTVGAVAARLGFSNPGRFAGLYRERFGETPLQTRRSHSAIRPACSPAGGRCDAAQADAGQRTGPGTPSRRAPAR